MALKCAGLKRRSSGVQNGRDSVFTEQSLPGYEIVPRI